MRKSLIAILVIMSAAGAARAQQANIAGKLGYPQMIVHNAKIVTVDDPSFTNNVGTIAQAMAIRDGKVLAEVALPVAGLLSDQRAPVVAKQTTALKRAWSRLGCVVPYMGFNLLPLSVIPELRLTDKGLVHVLGMKILPLCEPA